MIVRDQEIDVDITAELENFNWENATWDDYKLVAKSPFRREHSPSFFVRLQPFDDVPAGYWKDSGATSGYTHGSFPFLLAYLLNISVHQAEEYLLEKYGSTSEGYSLESIRLPRLKTYTPKRLLSEKLLEPYRHEHDYLLKRGIDASVIKQCEIGYDKTKKCVTIPWRNANGELANIKYRSVFSKVFWYEKNAVPISDLIYNINHVYKQNAKKIVITEAEIDAMTFHPIMCGTALGGSNFSDKKCEQIIKCPARDIYLAFDNDPVGKKLTELVAGKLKNYKNIFIVEFPDGFKDANEVNDKNILKNCLDNAKKYKKIISIKL